MKRPGYEYKKSSLLGMPKDAAIIMDRITSNQDALKLMKYTGKNWKNMPNVTKEEVAEMFESKQISSNPRIYIDKDKKTYLRLIYGTVLPNATNPEYRDNVFSLDIICHYDDWDLGDFDERPYRLAGEIDSMLDGTKLTGIGVLEFVSLNPYVYDEEFAGVTLTYLAIRGNEDKVNPLT